MMNVYSAMYSAWYIIVFITIILFCEEDSFKFEHWHFNLVRPVLNISKILIVTYEYFEVI